MNFLLNQLTEILVKESQSALCPPSQERIANGQNKTLENGKKEPVVTWVQKNFQVFFPIIVLILDRLNEIYLQRLPFASSLVTAHRIQKFT